MGHDASAHSGADFQIYMQTSWQRGRGGGCNSSILARSLAPSLTSCKCVHRWNAPKGPSLTDSSLTTSLYPETALLPAPPPQAEMEAWGEKGTESKRKSISRTNASQQKRPMKWLFKHSAVFSTSASQDVENCIENSPVQSWFKYINMSS